MAPRILLINQYFAPDIAATGQYAADICRDLAKLGFDIYVISGQPSYTSCLPLAPKYELMAGVHVYRVFLGKNSGRENFKNRTLGYIRFLCGAWKAGRKLVKSRKFQIVATFHNPPFIGFLGSSSCMDFLPRSPNTLEELEKTNLIFGFFLTISKTFKVPSTLILLVINGF